jgi:hypothetical protein
LLLVGYLPGTMQKFPTEPVPWTEALEKAVRDVSDYPLGIHGRKDLWRRVRTGDARALSGWLWSAWEIDAPIAFQGFNELARLVQIGPQRRTGQRRHRLSFSVANWRCSNRSRHARRPGRAVLAALDLMS